MRMTEAILGLREPQHLRHNMTDETTDHENEADVTDPRITALSPAAGALDEAGLVSAYSVADRSTPTLRMNFVTSLDGSATVKGLSGDSEAPPTNSSSTPSAGWPTSFSSARAPCAPKATGRCDCRMPMSVASRARLGSAAGFRPRVGPTRPRSGERHLHEGPRTAARAHLCGGTGRRARRTRRGRGGRLCGDDHVDPQRIVDALVDRGLPQILCEGGPSLFGTFIAADLVDELCLTVSPLLEGGAGIRISHGESEAARPMRLVHVLESDGLLLTRYARAR